jgi:GTP-binding protein
MILWAESAWAKVSNGSIAVNQDCVVVNHHDPDKLEKVRITKLFEFDGLKRVPVEKSRHRLHCGNLRNQRPPHRRHTICSPENPVSIPFQKISEPTISMNFIVNDSPFAGQDGKFVTSRQIRDRLYKELNTDVSLRVEDTDSTDTLKVSGRGELHLSVLIETIAPRRITNLPYRSLR